MRKEASKAYIGVDIGGTFTDAVYFVDGKIIRGKSLTTRQKLSEGFMQAIENLAEQQNYSLKQLLNNTELIRYSTTLATNLVIERKGPKLGLVTTAGHEHMLHIGRSRSWADGLAPHEIRNIARISRPEPLIPFELIVGIRERMDCFGNIVIPLDPKEVLEKVRYLIDRKVDGIVVSFLWSFINPAHEQIVRDIVLEEYAAKHLNILVSISSEVQPKWHELPRTNVTILCAYLQKEVSQQLSNLEKELQVRGYKGRLMIVNNQGGIATIERTRPVDMHDAGPVAGLFGASYISNYYGNSNIIISDMGGTSFDLGIIEKGSVGEYVRWPVIGRWAVETSMLEVKGIGAGGGSVAWINKLLGNKLEVGPISMGSYPGPACYDLGGSEPTVTDADVVLGYIDPTFYLGGKIRLNKGRSISTIKEKIADPYGISVEEAALRIKKTVDANMGNVITKEISIKGINPNGIMLFAYGGAGPTHCCGYATRAKIPKVITFPFASVFCALGCCTMDIKQVYERSNHIVIFDPTKPVGNQCLQDYDAFNKVVREMRDVALRERIEGIQPEQIQWDLQLEMRYPAQGNVVRVKMPLIGLEIHGEEDLMAVYKAFNDEYSRQYSRAALSQNLPVEIENFMLSVVVSVSVPEFQTFEPVGEDSSPALKGTRSVYWEDHYEETKIYSLEQLRCGNVVHGPSIIEAKDTTYVISKDFKYTLNKYLHGVIERVIM